MAFSSVVVASLLFLVARAAVFHLPLDVDNRAFASALARTKSDSHTDKGVVSEHRNAKRAFQQPLDAPRPFRRFHRVEIWDSVLPQVFATAAALGNPPQPFRLNIDLAWDALFVPSIDCDRTGADVSDAFRFQSNLSSTYQQGSSAWEWTIYAGVRFRGPVASDTLRIAGLEVQDQAFINVEEARTLGFFDLYSNYEGVLGLAPRWNASLAAAAATHLPSPWTTMVNQSLLDANLFALDLPHIPFDRASPPRLGELSFGGINPKYAASSFAALPLSDYTDRAWTIEAQSFTWANRTHPIHATFSNFTLAGFDTSSWYIGLPGTLADAINAQVPLTCSFLMCFVFCAQRRAMPDMVFGIGGKEVRVSASEYALEVGQGMCMFNVLEVGKGEFPVDAMVLGTPFLNAFYGVFDRDRREVRLAKPMV